MQLLSRQHPDDQPDIPDPPGDLSKLKTVLDYYQSGHLIIAKDLGQSCGFIRRA